jgi:hypothetical protein
MTPVMSFVNSDAPGKIQWDVIIAEKQCNEVLMGSGDVQGKYVLTVRGL